jgi:NAD(P)-dependent dehydrogenase (short-subunit alcohol dehydrogenase family)
MASLRGLSRSDICIRAPAPCAGQRRQIANIDDGCHRSALHPRGATELEGQAIDLLLNNAGIIGPRGQAVGNIDYDAWAEVLTVNTMGPMRGR